jgi:hypothetical protein
VLMTPKGLDKVAKLAARKDTMQEEVGALAFSCPAAGCLNVVCCDVSTAGVRHRWAPLQ